MKTLTIHQEKGGVGKTTLSAIIGAGLARKGNKVCLIDADPQGSLTTAMGVVQHGGFYAFTILNNPKTPDFVETRRLPVKLDEDKHPEGLRLIAGNGQTTGITSQGLLPELANSMARRLHELSRVFDFVIIDTKPSPDMLHNLLSLITDYYIIPTTPEPLSAYVGVPSAVNHINFSREQALARGHDKAKLLGIIPNMFRTSTKLHQRVYDDLIHGTRDDDGQLSRDDDGNILYKGYGDLVWDPIPLRINIAEGQLLQESIIHTAPDLTTSKILQTVVDKVEHLMRKEQALD